MNPVTEYPSGRKERQILLLQQMCALLEGETFAISHMANAASLLWHALPAVNWVGFYLRQGDDLLLGPFMGKPACLRIPFGKGVCGTAAAGKKVLRVADVHAFPGHIACDSASRSEIVIPLLESGETAAVLDIDSSVSNRFDEEDEEFLTEFARLVEKGCDLSAFR